MFLEFFYELREGGVPVGMQEWMMLMEAMKKGLHGSSLRRFYNLSRALLVKSETYFDAFDRVFLKVFEGVEGSLNIEDEVLEWLKDPKNFQELTDEQKQMLEWLSGDELMQQAVVVRHISIGAEGSDFKSVTETTAEAMMLLSAGVIADDGPTVEAGFQKYQQAQEKILGLVDQVQDSDVLNPAAPE